MREFKIYKHIEFNFQYKSTQSEQSALKKLEGISNNSEDAIKILETTMANGWKGFFPEKQNNNGTKNNTNTKSKYSTSFKEFINEKIRSD